MFNNKNYILFLTLLLASACTANTPTQCDNIQAENVYADQPCPLICSTVYELTCGFNCSNFQQFPNTCMMQAKNCRLPKEQTAQKPFIRTDDDWCTTKKVDNLNYFMRARNIDLNKRECSKQCSREFNSLCISNGEYRANLNNICLLDSVNCALKDTEFDSKRFRVLSETACEEGPQFQKDLN